MKRLLHLFFMISLVITQAHAQTSNAYATVRWQAPITAWSPLFMINSVHDNTITHIHAGVQFNWQKSPDCDRYGNIQGKPQMNVSSSDPGITIENVWVTVRGVACDGKPKIEICTPGTIPPYEHRSQQGNLTHNLKEIKEVIKCSFSYHVGKDFYDVYYDKESGINRFQINGKSISEFETEVKKKKEEELNKQMEKTRERTDKLINPPNSNNDEYIIIEGQLIKATEIQKKQPKSNVPGNGVRGDNNSPYNKPEVLASTNSNQNQQQNYQQQANAYLNASNNSNNNAIQQSLYLNLAKINAVASGNNAQVAQIQQMQSQQSTQQVSQLLQQAGDLVLNLMNAYDAPHLQGRYC